LLNKAKAAGKADRADKKAVSPRSMADLIQRAVITLLVLVCFISVIFASCAKTEPQTPAQDTNITQGNESPSVSPAL